MRSASAQRFDMVDLHRPISACADGANPSCVDFPDLRSRNMFARDNCCSTSLARGYSNRSGFLRIGLTPSLNRFINGLSVRCSVGALYCLHVVRVLLSPFSVARRHLGFVFGCLAFLLLGSQVFRIVLASCSRLLLESVVVGKTVSLSVSRARFLSAISPCFLAFFGAIRILLAPLFCSLSGLSKNLRVLSFLLPHLFGRSRSACQTVPVGDRARRDMSFRAWLAGEVSRLAGCFSGLSRDNLHGRSLGRIHFANNYTMGI